MYKRIAWPALVVLFLVATLLVGVQALGETYPSWVANGVTSTSGKGGAGGHFVFGVGGSVFDQRMKTLHVKAGVTDLVFNVWHGGDGGTEAWTRMLPLSGFTAADTTATVSAGTSNTFYFPGRYDLVYIKSGTGDLWGE